MSDEEPHDFDEEDSCAECGNTESSDIHDSDEADYQHDYEPPDVCSVCGMSEAEELHQTEE